MARDDFAKKTRDSIVKRSSYICSNPDCRNMTICAADDTENFTYIGEVSHITAAALGGPRHDASLEVVTRQSPENAIFLCSNCATMIDKNDGKDFSVDTLRNWKNKHEQWVKDNLNKSPHAPITTIDGEHIARGVGNVTAIKTDKPTFFKPGTKSVAEGIGNITAIHIGPDNNHE